MQKKNAAFSLALILACTFFSMFLSQAGVRAAAEVLPYALKTNGAEVTVYAVAEEGAAAIGQLPKDTVLYPQGQEGDWYQVSLSGGTIGYIAAAAVYAISAEATVAVDIGILYEDTMEEAAVLALIAKDTAVTLTGRTGDWFAVTLADGSVGYMPKAGLTAPAEDAPALTAFAAVQRETAVTAASQAAKIGSSAARVRSGPGTGYSTITTLAAGTPVTITGSAAGTDGKTWYAISCGSVSGYVRGDLLDLSPGSPDGKVLTGLVIVVDPGHGAKKTATSAYDCGAVGPTGAQEDHINLAIALSLRDKLVAQGAKVIMTRESNLSGVLGLTDRVNIANHNNADLFVSVHCNSIENSPSSGGTSTWYSTFGSDAGLLAARKSLGTYIQAQLVANLGIRNYGLREGDFTVINRTTMPAVLVESAFISNPQEEARLKTPEFRDKVAASIAAGLSDYVINTYDGFYDVINHWAKGAVEYVAEKGIFNGTTPTTFSPELDMTRGMLATVLYRMAGSPAASPSSFSDVKSSTYYANAIGWAAAKGVVDGIGDNKFAPDASITRQELVTMFHRYANAMGLTLPAVQGDSVTKYSDYGSVSKYAAAAVEWVIKAASSMDAPPAPWFRPVPPPGQRSPPFANASWSIQGSKGAKGSQRRMGGCSQSSDRFSFSKRYAAGTL